MPTKAQAHAEKMTAQYGPPLDCTNVREIGWRKLQSGQAACLYDWQSIPGDTDEKPAPFVFCPKCGNVMVERQNRKTGHSFLGCSGYPNCKETRRV